MTTATTAQSPDTSPETIFTAVQERLKGTSEQLLRSPSFWVERGRHKFSFIFFTKKDRSFVNEAQRDLLESDPESKADLAYARQQLEAQYRRKLEKDPADYRFLVILYDFRYAQRTEGTGSQDDLPPSFLKIVEGETHIAGGLVGQLDLGPGGDCYRTARHSGELTPVEYELIEAVDQLRGSKAKIIYRSAA